jgi:hypothetical protein
MLKTIKKQANKQKTEEKATCKLERYFAKKPIDPAVTKECPPPSDNQNLLNLNLQGSECLELTTKMKNPIGTAARPKRIGGKNSWTLVGLEEDTDIEDEKLKELEPSNRINNAEILSPRSKNVKFVIKDSSGEHLYFREQSIYKPSNLKVGKEFEHHDDDIERVKNAIKDPTHRSIEDATMKQNQQPARAEKETISKSIQVNKNLVAIPQLEILSDWSYNSANEKESKTPKRTKHHDVKTIMNINASQSASRTLNLQENKKSNLQEIIKDKKEQPEEIKKRQKCIERNKNVLEEDDLCLNSEFSSFQINKDQDRSRSHALTNKAPHTLINLIVEENPCGAIGESSLQKSNNQSQSSDLPIYEANKNKKKTEGKPNASKKLFDGIIYESDKFPPFKVERSCMEKIEIKEYLNQLIRFVEKHRIYFTSDAEAERYFKRCDRKGTRSEMSRFFLIYLFDNYVVFLY